MAECLCMPSPSRSQKMTPGTVATSGLSSLLRTCKSHKVFLFFLFLSCLFSKLLFLLILLSLPHSEGDMVSLRLLQLAFSERKCLASGKILYEVCSAHKTSAQFFTMRVLCQSQQISCRWTLLGLFFSLFNTVSLRVWSTVRNVTVRS